MHDHQNDDLDGKTLDAAPGTGKAVAILPSGGADVMPQTRQAMLAALTDLERHVPSDLDGADVESLLREIADYRSVIDDAAGVRPGMLVIAPLDAHDQIRQTLAAAGIEGQVVVFHGSPPCETHARHWTIDPRPVVAKLAETERYAAAAAEVLRPINELAHREMREETMDSLFGGDVLRREREGRMSIVCIDREIDFGAMERIDLRSGGYDHRAENERFNQRRSVRGSRGDRRSNRGGRGRR